MTPEDLKRCSEMLRRIADEIDRGEWGSVDVRIENDQRDKPHYAGHYRGKELAGRLVTASLALPRARRGADE